MLYQMTDDSGALMDAHYDIDGSVLILHSRGGTRGDPNARNTQYGDALRLLLRRIREAELQLDGVWVDSNRVQHLPLEERQILSPHEATNEPGTIFTMLSSRMAGVGRDPTSRIGRGNSSKRIRFGFSGAPSGDVIARLTGGFKVEGGHRRPNRLTPEDFSKITAEHIWRAVQKLSDNRTSTKFGPSTDYDVIADDGKRLPPKAVFGEAASDALGFEVLPSHFLAGLGNPAFKAIQSAGYFIVGKGEPPQPTETHSDPEDRVWSEGNPRLETHLRKERATGLGRAKKAQFLRVHGKLFCERCGLDPAELYGPELGDACIEAHHAATLVSEMGSDHATSLDDLQCLCANCHRVVHRELRMASA